MFVSGQTFFFPSEYDRHRWVIVSDPQKYPHYPVIIVNFTTFNPGKDFTCIVSSTDFPTLGSDSCIHYRMAKPVELSNLQRLINSGYISLSLVVPAPVLKRIREGFGRSKLAANKLKDILRHQNLIQ